MKAIVLDRLGGPETLRVAEMPTPEPAPGEIRVRVRAAGLNPADYKHIAEGAPDWQFPKITGCDFAGEVDALGAGVEMPLGLRVLVKTPLAMLGRLCGILPPCLRISRCRCLMASASFKLLHCRRRVSPPTRRFNGRLQVQAGDLVLIMGGSGGVGGFRGAARRIRWCDRDCDRVTAQSRLHRQARCTPHNRLRP